MGTLKNAQYYNKIYASSEKYRTHYKNSPYYVLWTQVMQLVKQIPSPVILEIGCGTGQFAHYLYDEGYKEYNGFDFSEEAIKIAKSVVDQSFSVGDALNKESYKRDYNLVIALEVLEHVSDDFAVLNNIREGANIIFTLPTFDDPAHLRYFKTPRDIVKRYYKYIDIKKIIPIDIWFVCYGTVQKFNPKLINRLLKTRRGVKIKDIIDGVKHLLRINR